MTEVEKLYELAGVDFGYNNFGVPNIQPPFTAEKQLELIKWLIIEGYIEDMLTVQISEENFEACLADTFNELWQDLTEEEKQQIKEILG